MERRFTDTLMSASKVQELDIMKFYGILLVVLGHVAMTYTPMSLITPVNSSFFMNTVKQIIYSFHMPMFVFVSGCVFAYQLEVKKKIMTLKNVVLNKSKRLLIPFYTFGFLWVLPTMVALGFRSPLHYAIDGFILAIDSRHLWYVMMLFWCFILFFGLRTICIRLKWPLWVIAVCATVLYIVRQLVYIPYLQIGNMMEYFLWFTYGYFFLLYKHTKYLYTFHSLFLLFLMGGVKMFPFVSNVSHRIVWAIIGILIFWMISGKYSKIVNTRFYRWITPNSFGIYLFHPMIIYVLEYEFRATEENPIVLSFVIFSISLWLSGVLTIFVRKYLSPILIGEK